MSIYREHRRSSRQHGKERPRDTRRPRRPRRSRRSRKSRQTGEDGKNRRDKRPNRKQTTIRKKMPNTLSADITIIVGTR